MPDVIRVVLVDDHSLIRAGIREFLSRALHINVVGEANSGQSAKEIIAQLTPQLLLIDIELPDITGIELTAWIRANYPSIKIIILSAHDNDDYIMAALQAGANGYSMKNTSPGKLIEAVDAVWANQSALDPSIATKVMGFAMGAGKPSPSDSDLSERETQVLTLVARGKTNKEIGAQLFISGRTVQGHLSKIFSKLGVETPTEAVVKSASNRLIKIEYDDQRKLS